MACDRSEDAAIFNMIQAAEAARRPLKGVMFRAPFCSVPRPSILFTCQPGASFRRFSLW